MRFDSRISSFILLAAICLLAVLPFVWRGSPSGHDFEFHMYSWMEVLSQWRQGIVYPRWAALAHWGYGEARFLFYPPGSWTLGAAIGSVLPWKAVPGAYVFVVLLLSGLTMLKLAREWLPARDALFAAIFYAVNPYHLVIVYWRSAYAELLAAALLPLLVLCVLRLDGRNLRSMVNLALLLAAAWMVNAPSAVMIHYSLAILVLAKVAIERSWRPVLHAAAAVALGAGLASFYLIPAAYEEKWVNIAEVLSPGVRPQDNFLFTTISDPDHNRFNLLVSFVALSEIVVAALAVAIAHRRPDKRKLWPLLSIWVGVTVLIMFSITNTLWQHLPKLRFVQLPWRWLLCLNAALAVLLTVAFRHWAARAMASAALLAVVITVGYRVQQPWWDTAADIREMSNAMADGTGYEGTDEYVPLSADSYELEKNARRVTAESPQSLKIKIEKWGPLEKQFSAENTTPQDLTLRLFNYPAWRVLVNGKPVATKTTEITGQLQIPVPAGPSEIEIRFDRTPDRTIGGLVSLVSLGALLVLWMKMRNEPGLSANPIVRVLIATSNPGKLRDFAGAAAAFGVEVAGIPHFSSLPPVIEDGATFEANARKKAEEYSLAVPGELVLGDDSGLEIDALGGAPGVHSARYAADEPHTAEANTDDEANNARVLRELVGVPNEKRTARFVCVLVAARDGHTLAIFRGAAEGLILTSPRGTNGFGYDPLFYFPEIQKTFAELSAEEKARFSHRGKAFREFLNWYRTS